jgi:hypothetical protein
MVRRAKAAVHRYPYGFLGIPRVHTMVYTDPGITQPTEPALKHRPNPRHVAHRN